MSQNENLTPTGRTFTENKHPLEESFYWYCNWYWSGESTLTKQPNKLNLQFWEYMKWMLPRLPIFKYIFLIVFKHPDICTFNRMVGPIVFFSRFWFFSFFPLEMLFFLFSPRPNKWAPFSVHKAFLQSAGLAHTDLDNPKLDAFYKDLYENASTERMKSLLWQFLQHSKECGEK